MRCLIAFLIAALLAAPAVAQKAPAQKECPFGFSEREEVVNAIKKASCDDAIGLFEACQTNAGGDTAYGEAVVAVCEPSFVTALKPDRKRAYAAEHKRCDTKYAKREGTMYRSFTAFCHAEVAQKYARRFGKAAR